VREELVTLREGQVKLLQLHSVPRSSFDDGQPFRLMLDCVRIILEGELFEFGADFGGQRRNEVNVVEFAFQPHGHHVGEGFEHLAPRIAVRPRVDLCMLNGPAEGLEEIEDGRSGLDGLVATIYPERQKSAAWFVDETEVEEGERVKVLQGPVLWKFRVERVFWREHLGETDYRFSGLVALDVDFGGRWYRDSREEEGDVHVSSLVVNDR